MPYPATFVKSLNFFFFEKNAASYVRPPVLNGHFRLAVVVAAQKRLYCGGNCIIRERSAGLINHVEKSLIIRSYTYI